jgi:hypothetical protein
MYIGISSFVKFRVSYETILSIGATLLLDLCASSLGDHTVD